VKSLKFIRAQSVLEYAVIISFVVTALLAMSIYMKRAAEGKLRESSDQLGEQFEAGETHVYSHNTRTGITIQKVNPEGESGLSASYSDPAKDSESTMDTLVEDSHEEVGWNITPAPPVP
jgi:hypothetical protein